MNKLKKIIFVFLIAIIAAVICELLLFNYKSLTTKGARWNPLPEPEITEDESDNLETIVFKNINRSVDYLHLNIMILNNDSKPLPTEFSIFLLDEGNSAFYRAGTVSYTQAYLKESYFKINAYGSVKDIKIQFRLGEGNKYSIQSAEINGAVPFFISKKRIVILFLLFMILYAIRPSSSLYDNVAWSRLRGSKIICAAMIIVINITMLGYFTSLNEKYVEPEWEWHQQYAKLARAFTDGKTYIDTPEQEKKELLLLAELEDPYDKAAREELFADYKLSSPWDTAYYAGHLYVYFGVVPVIFAYLPYYLITGKDLQTVSLLLVIFTMIVIGAFTLVHTIVKRYFPDTPFVIYVMLSLLLGNCTCVAEYTLVPSFYTIPITFSTALVYFALSLWISAVQRWELSQSGTILQIIVGTVFAALVAGCRPQFLVFSFLLIPIFWNVIIKRNQWGEKKVVILAAITTPYIVIAAMLMYYNYIRFGSVFDFGANYNLTTNNMPLRGWKISRLPDGFFEYLFRVPNIDLQFPFIHSASTQTPYIGMTIRDVMFGGVLLTNIFLWILFFIRRAYVVLREKGLFIFTVICIASSMLVIAADTEMAGILWRYTGDFLPLLYIAAIVMFLSIYQTASESEKRGLTIFLTVALCVTVISSILFGITDGKLQQWDPDSFYKLRNFFS